MNSFNTRYLLVLALAVFTSDIYGQLVICDPVTGTAFTHPAGPTMYFTDGGVTGAIAPIPTFTLADADFLTDAAFSEWTAVSTSTFTAVDGGPISAVAPGYPSDIDETNIGMIFDPSFMLSTPNGPGIYVIYDDDGAISSLVGAPPGVLGFATPEITDPASCTIVESYAVINLGEIDPLDVPPTYAVPGANYGGVFTHEIGHALNLSHKQTVGNIYFGSIGDSPLPFGCAPLPAPAPTGPDVTDLETMYPFLDVSGMSMTGIAQASVDVPDDLAALSDLYPTAGWFGSTGIIFGTIIDIDGASPLGGVNVVARNVEAPFSDAVSQLSGASSQLPADGTFMLTGLTPGEVYILYAEPIVAGAFSQSPVAPLPGGAPEEFWNGPSESNIGFPGATGEDVFCDTLKIVPIAGSPFVADIILNDPSLGEPFAVELLTFSGQAVGRQIRLFWESTREDQHQLYVVEWRNSGDRPEWQSIGEVEARGSGASYFFLTEKMDPGTQVFRLKQVDVQGEVSYSSTIEIDISGDVVRIYPNPTNDGLYLDCPSCAEQATALSVFDLTGQELFQTHLAPGTGHHIDLSGLPAGLYFLSGQVGTVGFTKLLKKLP